MVDSSHSPSFHLPIIRGLPGRSFVRPLADWLQHARLVLHHRHHISSTELPLFLCAHVVNLCCERPSKLAFARASLTLFGSSETRQKAQLNYHTASQSEGQRCCRCQWHTDNAINYIRTGTDDYYCCELGTQLAEHVRRYGPLILDHPGSGTVIPRPGHVGSHASIIVARESSGHLQSHCST